MYDNLILIVLFHLNHKWKFTGSVVVNEH